MDADLKQYLDRLDEAEQFSDWLGGEFEELGEFRGHTVYLDEYNTAFYVDGAVNWDNRNHQWDYTSTELEYEELVSMIKEMK